MGFRADVPSFEPCPQAGVSDARPRVTERHPGHPLAYAGPHEIRRLSDVEKRLDLRMEHDRGELDIEDDR